MILNKCLFTFILCLSIYLGLSHILPAKCVTPNNKPGNCILLENCPSLNNMSNDFETPMTLERFNFLANSQCMFKNGILTVCCSLDELVTDEEQTLQES